MRNAFPKIYLYRRIVQAKPFIDQHYAEPINLDSMADEAYFSKFHFIRKALFVDDSGNWFSLGEKKE